MSALPYVKKFKELEVYRKARRLAKGVFEVSCRFPKEDRYSLTDQLRRSSGSIGAQIAEAWGKRKYEKHFISKLTDADSEQLETQHWILICQDRGYMTAQEAENLDAACEEIGRMIGHMILRAPQFCRGS
ncbi:MAG: four helix bundle protein [Verrucomicrobiales bacterium]